MKAENCRPERFGFGVEVMKRIKVCGYCGMTESADRYICSRCGNRLPEKTLFHRYQQRHRLCPVCDTVLAQGMRFCPHCGAPQNERTEDER